MKRQQSDIVISGGGVAGLTAAVAFGNAGFTVTLLDPTPPITDAKDQNADMRTTAFLQPARAFLDEIGLWSRFAPFATPLQIMQIVDAAQDPVVTRAFDAADISDAPFGWNLPNWLLRRELTAAIAQMDTIDFRMGTGFANALPRLRENIVTLDDGSQIATNLLIGADGRNSAVRRTADIPVTTTRYGQKAIVFAVNHDAPHHNISTEVHKDGGPFTLVPLPDSNGKPCSAVVWMSGGAQIMKLAQMDDPAFAAAATERSAGVYGTLTLANRRSVWPIISQVADRLTAERTALIAEAAHVMPPIGAQGLNMSLADIADLLDLAKTYKDTSGAPDMLDRYQEQRHRDIQFRVKGIDALNRASIAGHPLMHDLRGLGLRALHDLAPIRRRIMAVGLGVNR